MLNIKHVERNDDFVGYILTLEDGRKIGVQFDIENNCLHADYNTIIAGLVDMDDPCFRPQNLSDEEQIQLLELVYKNEEIREHIELCDQRYEEWREEDHESNFIMSDIF